MERDPDLEERVARLEATTADLRALPEQLAEVKGALEVVRRMVADQVIPGVEKPSKFDHSQMIQFAGIVLVPVIIALIGLFTALLVK